MQIGAKAVRSPLGRATVYRLFVDALEMQEHLRDQFLARECEGDTESRADIEDLLRLAINDQTATRALLPKPPPQQPVEDLLGRDYGRFRLVELIGVGGMGVVYRAERTDGVKQCVAIKVASHTVASAAQARFESEAQTLARLEHPAVARLIDAGLENGRAWIAMEFVDGERIDKYSRNRGLGHREIVALVVQLADAVSTAHRLLVVHSDIKPANVIVTAEGTPKLIDFGIATVSRDAQATPAAAAARVFSPGFAAPEQISGGGVTVATDVFGLAALAYHLLTGTPPHGADDIELSYAAAVTTRDVVPASQAAAAVGRSPAEVQRLRGDLDAILGKALERDAQQRYASAADLRADLVRFLERRPVRARRASPMYRLKRFTQRNALACSLAVLLLLSLITGGAVMAVQSHREAVARNMAARRDAFLESLLKSADPRGGRRDISVAELLDTAASELDAKLSGEPLVEASMLGVIAQTDNGLGRYAEGLVANDRQVALLRSHVTSDSDLGQALSLRGDLLRELGKWRDAEPVLQEAVARLRGGRPSAELCEALYLLGSSQAHLGQEEDGLRYFREAIDIESRGDRRLQQQRMFPYHAMAVTLANLGRYREALEYARDAVNVAQQALPAEHPDLLSLQTTYAGALVNAYQYGEAEALFRRIIDSEIRVLGEDHKDTLLAQLLLADELLELNRNAEAAQLAQSVAQRLDSLLGADNWYTLLAWQEYGSAACNEGQLDVGLQTLRRVQSAWQRIVPPGDRLLQAAGLSVGTCLYRAQRFGEAEVALLAAQAGLEAGRGPAYRRTQEAYRALRDLYASTGRKDEAQRWAGKLTH